MSAHADARTVHAADLVLAHIGGADALAQLDAHADPGADSGEAKIQRRERRADPVVGDGRLLDIGQLNRDADALHHVAEAAIAADPHLHRLAHVNADRRQALGGDLVALETDPGGGGVSDDDAPLAGQHAIAHDAHLGGALDDRDARPNIGHGDDLARRGGDQADPVVPQLHLARALLDRNADLVGGDHVRLPPADLRSRRLRADEDADPVRRGAALGIDADPVAVNRIRPARIAHLDRGDRAGADHVAPHCRLRAVDDQHAVVVGQRQTGGVEADRVVGQLRVGDAGPAGDDAVAGLVGRAVAGDAVVPDARARRAAQHGDAAQSVGRGAQPIGRHAQPVRLDQRIRRARADHADPVARETADRQPAHDGACAVDHDPRRIAGRAAVEIDERRRSGAPAGLGRRVERDLRGAQRRQRGVGRDHRRADDRKPDPVPAIGLVGGANRGAQAAYGGAVGRARILGGGDGPEARRTILRERVPAAEQRAEQQGGGGEPFQRSTPDKRAADSTRMCSRSPLASSYASPPGAASRVV